jgi:hypothetical protein
VGRSLGQILSRAAPLSARAVESAGRKSQQNDLRRRAARGAADVDQGYSVDCDEVASAAAAGSRAVFLGAVIVVGCRGEVSSPKFFDALTLSERKENDNMNNLRACLLTLLSGIVLSVFSACGPLNGNLDDLLPTATIPTPIPRRSITQATLPLHEMWRKDVLKVTRYNGSDYTPSQRIFAPYFDKLYVVGINPVNDAVQILALNQTTGEQLWATNQMLYIEDFTASQEALYIVSGEHGIVAYDAVTGNVKWTSDQPRPNHQGYYLSYNAPALNLIISQGPQFSYTTIDLQSGKVGDKQIADGPLLAIDSQYRYLLGSKGTLRLEDVNTNQSEQLISPSGYLLRSGNVLAVSYLRDSLRNAFHSVIVLDLITKQKLWDCQECFASDVAVDDNRLYAINRDGLLGGYDLSTGKLLGTVDFSGGSKIAPRTILYGVTALNGRVFLYFSDVQQIIALGP